MNSEEMHLVTGHQTRFFVDKGETVRVCMTCGQVAVASFGKPSVNRPSEGTVQVKRDVVAWEIVNTPEIIV